MPVLNSRARGKNRDVAGNIIPVSSDWALWQVGPRLQLTLSPLEEHVKAATDKGETIPQPVGGFALIDTGAAVTCVDRAAADSAGLAMVDSGFMTSATHEAEVVPIYAGKLDIAGLPNNIVTHRAYGANLTSQGLVALIGRDVLQRCVLVYNGLDGSFSLSL